MKKNIKIILFYFILLFVVTILFSLFAYKKEFSLKTIENFIFGLNLFIFLVFGFYIGRKKKNNGFFNSLIFASLIFISITLFNFLSTDTINYYSFVRYLILLLVSCLGGVVSINLQKK